jgi:putative DNA primase/helicase
MTPAEVLICRKQIWAQGFRPIAIWNPDETVDDRGQPLRNPGKQPRGRWTEDATRTPPRAASEQPHIKALNTGILCGDIALFDVDILDPELVDQVVVLVEERLGRDGLVRVGRAPKIGLLYRTERAFAKDETPEFILLDGTKAQLEVLCSGQQFVALGVHPETHKPYYWRDGRSPENTPLADLPLVTEGDARAICGAAEQLFRDARGQEIKQPRAERPKRNGSGGSFFAEVNNAALHNIASWVRQVFPTAKFQSGTSAWRVGSKDLGRALEEDISIHPDGCWDFGKEEPLSPIDLVISHGGAPKAVDAAMWLCDRLGINPTDLGHSQRQQPPPPPPSEKPDGPEPEPRLGAAVMLPTITVSAGYRHEAADRGLAALHAAGVPFYQRDRALVRITLIKARNSDKEVIAVPGIDRVTPATLGRSLGLSAIWQKINSKGQPVRIDPPDKVVEQIAGMLGEWPFPPLFGLITCPTLRSDGSLLDAEGYDGATGLVLYKTVSVPDIPKSPTRDDAERALKLLKELLTEFPFTNEASRAVALSQLMTPVVRGAFAVAPMHLINAPDAGTGKSYLTDIASAISTGERCAVVSVSQNPEETEKRLIGAALAGYPIIDLDNVSERLEGDFLAQVTERPLLQLRRLGASDPIRIANAFTVFANGNNVAVVDDLVRRTVRCGMDANTENPEARTFSNDPLAMALRNRGQYIVACLTIARAYIAAGKPGRLTPLPSYEGWSDFVRCPIVWLGETDPVSTIIDTRSYDPVRRDRAAFFSAWRDELSLDQEYQAGELIEHAESRYTYDNSLVRPQFHAALLAIASQSKNPGRIESRRLGRWLTKNENTIAGNFKLVVNQNDRSRVKYKLERVALG